MMMSKRMLLQAADSDGYVTWKQARRFAQGHDWFDEFVDTFKACAWGDKVYAEDLLDWAGY
jgi:hypothetical protein